MARVPLCRLDELADGQLLTALPGEYPDPVLVVARAGQVHVVDGLCPHQYAPLLGAHVADHVLTCALHGWRFDLRTGVSPDSPMLRVRRWPATVVDGVVMVDLAE